MLYNHGNNESDKMDKSCEVNTVYKKYVASPTRTANTSHLAGTTEMESTAG